MTELEKLIDAALRGDYLLGSTPHPTPTPHKHNDNSTLGLALALALPLPLPIILPLMLDPNAVPTFCSRCTHALPTLCYPQAR